MPNPLPTGQEITVHHGCFESGFRMDSLQMATDHYNIGITLQGKRRTITPLLSYSYQAGDVALAPPYLFHRTVAESDGIYERIMIKFSPKFVEPFIQQVGQHTFDRLYENLVYHFSPESQTKLKSIFYNMLAEYEKKAPYREFILQGMLYYLFITILDEHIPTETELHPTPLAPQIINAICYMEDHYRSQPSLNTVAEHVGFSAGYFSRLFHQQLGMPYNTYLNNIQIRHVQILLTNTDKSIMEIAQETGYCHGDYLSAQFKKKVGMTPRQYRRQHTQSQ